MELIKDEKINIEEYGMFLTQSFCAVNTSAATTSSTITNSSGAQPTCITTYSSTELFDRIINGDVDVKTLAQSLHLYDRTDLKKIMFLREANYQNNINSLRSKINFSREFCIMSGKLSPHEMYICFSCQNSTSISVTAPAIPSALRSTSLFERIIMGEEKMSSQLMEIIVLREIHYRKDFLKLNSRITFAIQLCRLKGKSSSEEMAIFFDSTE